jgi:hypothetical protein
MIMGLNRSLFLDELVSFKDESVVTFINFKAVHSRYFRDWPQSSNDGDYVGRDLGIVIKQSNLI